MKKYIPNILTLLNLFFGCLAIVSLFTGEWPRVLTFALIGLFFDFMDGLVARGLKVYSPLGKELDSLADMVTFGVLPGTIMYHLMVRSFTGDVGLTGQLVPEALPGFLLTLFAALRLAKFNLDTRQTDSFIGLPTPSATGFVVGLLMIFTFNELGLGAFVLNPIVLYGTTIILSYLMISEIPMFSMKFKNLKWKGNELRFIYLIFTLVAFVTIKYAAFSLWIIVYVIVSLLNNWFAKSTEMVEEGVAPTN